MRVWGGLFVFLTMLSAGVVLLFCGGAFAAGISLFTPPNNFWIGVSRGRNPSIGGVRFYGPTNPKASWYIAAWNNPGKDLPPFTTHPGGDGVVTYTSATSAASVVVEKAGLSTTVTLFQNNADMPCKLASGGPGEFDLLAGMNHWWINRAYPDASLPGVRANQIDRLSNMAALLQTVSVRPVKEWMPYATPRCRVNQGNLMVAVVLRDDSTRPKQILYYELALRTICHPGPTYNVCMARRGRSGFWWTGNLVGGPAGNKAREYGFRDTLLSYGLAMAGPNSTKKVSLDLLPVLSRLLHSGQHGLDKELSNWRIMSAYFGQNVWGDVGLSSQWKEYGLSVVLK
jgi:hypothetical protein